MNRTPIRAPEFPQTLTWFNTPSALSLAEQRGKVVLLDFWTYCCINCMHVLPDLAYLEQQYPQGLVVIGIHSPKFPNERVEKQVQKAINRYHIQHPVAHDPLFELWQHYGIRAWPSMAVIDPEGYLVTVLAGEGHRQQLDHLIAELLAQAERQGIRQYTPMAVQLTPEPIQVLRFPGKIHATAERLYISDSGHQQILETNWAGKVLRRFGSGQPGFQDGQPQEAQFRDPQGLVKVENNLYVADRQNHALRTLDLATGTVTTLAGNGEQGHHRRGYFETLNQAQLNSPWDLAYQQGILYIAMAGSHQIWSLNLALSTLTLYAGSGREDILDGSAQQAAFAQPSGLSIGEHILYVADSETSAVRGIHLVQATTTTWVGRGLFEFGDRDAEGQQARLQHPLAVAWDAQRHGLWIADTYNSKIKWLSLESPYSVRTEPLHWELNEPGGLSLYEDTLWIADTNNHQIVRYDIPQRTCLALTLTCLTD